RLLLGSRLPDGVGSPSPLRFAWSRLALAWPILSIRSLAILDARSPTQFTFLLSSFFCPISSPRALLYNRCSSINFTFAPNGCLIARLGTFLSPRRLYAVSCKPLRTRRL